MSSRLPHSIAQIEPVRFEQGRPMLLAGLRRSHEFLQAPSGIVEQWREFQSAGPLAGQVGSATYGVMCGLSGNTFEYMCAAEVGDFARLPPGTGRMRIAAEHYAVFVHRGPLSALKTTWDAIFEWLSTSVDYQSAHKPDFEVYDGAVDPAIDHRDVEIRVAVTPRALYNHPASP